MEQIQPSPRALELQKAFTEGRDACRTRSRKAGGARSARRPRGLAKIRVGRSLRDRDCRCRGRGIVDAGTYNQIMREREEARAQRRAFKKSAAHGAS